MLGISCVIVLHLIKIPVYNVKIKQSLFLFCRQIEQLRRCEIIKESEVKALCAKAREILVEESNVQRVDSPVTVSNQIYVIIDESFRI